jgi:hypothetical protein
MLRLDTDAHIFLNLFQDLTILFFFFQVVGNIHII